MTHSVHSHISPASSLIGYSCLFLMLIASFVSCDNNKEGNHVEFESYAFDTVARWTEQDSIPGDDPASALVALRGQGILPVSIGGKPVAELRDSLESLANVKFVNAKAEPILDDALAPTDLKAADTDPCSIATNILSLQLMTPDVIVWKDRADFYPCKSAHGRYTTTFVNYSIPKQKILSLNDIFRPGYQKVLLPMLKEKLSENPEVFPDADIRIPKVFFLTNEGISFVYGIYEIAPFSAGEIVVSFFDFELNDILAPGSPLAQND